MAPGATDNEVFRLASNESRIVVTNDKDFGEIAYRERHVGAGVLLLRFQTQDGMQKAAYLARILPMIEDRIPGHFTVVTETRVRVRPLSG